MLLVSALISRRNPALVANYTGFGCGRILMKKPKQSFQKAIGLLLFTLAGFASSATNYYFSSVSGDDSRTAAQAQNPSTPWRSIDKLNAIFHSLVPGDTVFLRRGEIFHGSIFPTSSGSASHPIVITAFGQGAQPVVSGLQRIQAWSSRGGNVWEAAGLSTSNINVLVINGQAKPIGRYPNTGYLSIDSHNGNTSITDDALATGTNWSGGEVVIRKNRWIIDRNRISSHSGSTVNYQSESGYHATDKYGYFLQNHPAALDQEGEWYFQNGRLGIYANSNPSGLSVDASVVPTLVQLYQRSYIVFSSLDFVGANQTAIKINQGQNITFADCNIRNSGENAVDASDVHALKILRSEILSTANVALNITNCHSTVLQNNTVANTGTVAGMGKSGDGTYTALLISGDNNTVEGNKIENTGYVPLSFNGSSVLIKNNFINRFTLVKDDGGGIYTWNNSASPPNYTNRRVEGNIIINGVSASAGTNDPARKYSHGIYMDDNVANVELLNNTVANQEGFGFYIHNARSIAIKGNTAYNNTVQLLMEHDDIAPNSPIRNTEVRNNILFSLQPHQIVAEYKSRQNDLNDFGSFDENIYSRPTNDNAVIGTLRNENGNYSYQAVDVDGWKAMSGKDNASKGSPKTFPTYHVANVLSGNLFGNGSFNNNIGGLYAFSPANNCQTAWSGNGLDGGSLTVSFSNITNNSKGTVVLGVGAVSAGKKYRLRFSLKGGNENKMLDVYLRKSGAPYNDVTGRNLVAIKPNRKEVELLLEPTESTGDGSIGIDVPEQSSVVYIDNIELREVTASPVNLADSIKFIYNPDASVSVSSLPGNFIDVQNAVYSGTVSTQPFSSIVLLANGSTVTPPPPAANCSATGSILREQWNNVPGNDVSNLSVTAQPSLSGQINLFEGSQNAGERYGSRIRGYICPPTTGNYTFYIAGDDATELWLSNSESPSQKQKIAYNLSWTGFREWEKYPTQKSAPVYLEAGKKYYIEALHKEGNGGDHLSVAWLMPGGAMEAPIPGNRLSPFQVAPMTAQTISFSALQSVYLGGAPLTLNATASSGLPVTYTIVSGPATINGNIVTTTSAGVVVIKASQSGDSQFEPAPDVLQSLTVLPALPVAQCNAAGTILWEQWTNVNGNDITQIPLGNASASSRQLTVFEGPVDLAERYGSRIRGYICAPQSGNYTFYIAGDDATELWLSSDESVGNKTKIAYNLSWTGHREWTKYSTQKSVAVYLEAGRKYYIEALHKEGNGGDHLSVAWTMPNGVFEAPIAGTRLSPFIPTAVNQCSATGTILREEWKNISGNDVSQIPQMSMPSSAIEVSGFEHLNGSGENYGSRIRGFICPPTTGNYTFYIAGDDATELWLSSSALPSGRKRIAYNLSWTAVREWNKYASQKSSLVFLEAGKKYYIEALHKQGGGGDHLSVAWQLPDGMMEAPISGSRLSPVLVDVLPGFSLATARTEAAREIAALPELKDDARLKVRPNPFSQRAIIQVTAPGSGLVRLDICDISGRVVKLVFNGTLKEKETRQFEFAGTALTKGTYVVRMFYGGTVNTCKIVKLD